eukprot:6211458-Pleurochrysis_carterae.AAC.1
MSGHFKAEAEKSQRRAMRTRSCGDACLCAQLAPYLHVRVRTCRFVCMRACVRVGACVCVRAWVRAWVRACVRECARARACGRGAFGRAHRWTTLRAIARVRTCALQPKRKTRNASRRGRPAWARATVAAFILKAATREGRIG